MRSDSRVFAAVEMAGLFVLWALTIWVAWKFSGASLWTASGIFVMAMTVLCSTLIRRPGWKSSGFRVDNFWPSLIFVGLLTFCMLGLFVVTSQMAGLSFPPLSGRTVIRFLLSGLLQQAFFLGYLFHRWTALLKNPRGAVIANALSFALIHLPHPSLVAITALGGLFLGTLFLRFQNVFVLGLAHGLFVLFFAPALYHTGMTETVRIGPPTFGPMSETIVRELRPGDRIGICSQTLVPGQFGRTFDRPIERIGHGLNDNDPSLREQVQLFLTAKERIFCVITEQDFYRHVDPELRNRLSIKQKWYGWKHKLTLDRAFAKDFFSGSDDVPVLGALRDRILLVSNPDSTKEPLCALDSR